MNGDEEADVRRVSRFRGLRPVAAGALHEGLGVAKADHVGYEDLVEVGPGRETPAHRIPALECTCAAGGAEAAWSCRAWAARFASAAAT